MNEVSSNIILVILVTSFATYLSRFLGVVSSEKIKETSKWFRWFNCLAYSTLAALITRTIIFPVGVLDEASYLLRFLIVLSVKIVSSKDLKTLLVLSELNPKMYCSTL